MIAHDIDGDFTAYLNAQDEKSMLRFITCGSVDDGKSTLIGRLLYEAHLLYEDHLSALASDSKKFGTTGEELDFALLVDGLAAEREQGITIDVAYRFFSTSKRKFIVADTPGHEQYTRNMATGASTADLAIVMVDARKGLLTQTRRHSFIVSLLGVKNIILAVNKMDLMDYQQDVFNQIHDDYKVLAQTLGFNQLHAIPVSALKGDNIVTLSAHMPWYQGPYLLQCLEDITVRSDKEEEPLRMSVQWVNRPNLDFRGFTGRINTGTLHPGDKIKVLPSGKVSTVQRLVSWEGDLTTARAGQSVTCTLSDEIDVSRGDVFTAADKPCEVADQFEATLLWMSEQVLVGARQYIFKLSASTTFCSISKPKYRIDVNTMQRLAAKELQLNEIGCCEIALDRAIPFEHYAKNRELGGFILIDRITNETVGAGFINFALRRATNVHKQDLLVSPEMRARIKLQKPAVLWLTGLSGSGKSTIANLVERELCTLGKHTMLLDGDNVRHGLNRDLGFTETDRAENIRRVAEVAKLMSEAGLITLVSFISPFRAEREMAKRIIGEEQFLEVFVDASLAVVESRDVKGLYKKARAGEIKNFTGIGSPYETPVNPDLIINTEALSEEASAKLVLNLLKTKEVM